MEQGVEHRAIRHPLGIGRCVAIEAIFTDIEEECRQVFVAKLGQQTDISVKVKIIDRRLQLRVHIREQMEHITLQLGHIGNRNLFRVRKAVERAEQIAEGVAQFAILVGNALQDFLADPVVFGEVHGQRPQPQNIRAAVAHQVERVDRIAQRLGHFHALLIHRKAVGQHRVIGRTAPRAAALQQARLEPATMLVTAFEIKVRWPLQVRPTSAFKDERMRAAGIEPDVQNVGDAFIIGERIVAAQIFLCAFVAPAIDATFANARDDTCVHARVAEILARLAIHKKRDRHAPCALAGQHPIGAAFDHRGDTILALFRNPAGVRNRGHCGFSQRPKP